MGSAANTSQSNGAGAPRLVQNCLVRPPILPTASNISLARAHLHMVQPAKSPGSPIRLVCTARRPAHTFIWYNMPERMGTPVLTCTARGLRTPSHLVQPAKRPGSSFLNVHCQGNLPEGLGAPLSSVQCQEACAQCDAYRTSNIQRTAS